MAPLLALAAVLWTPNRRALTRTFSFSALGAVVAGLLLVISLPSEARQKILRLIQGFNADQYVISSTEASDAQRLTVLKNGLIDWQSYPVFGSGIRHIPEAHNIYLQLLAAGGVVLLIAMLLYWFWILRDGWRLSQLGIVYARFLMISIVGGWLILGVVENALTDRYEYFTVGCIAALASANLTRRQDRTQVPESLAKAQSL
jgi:O-antigen ligase